MKNINRVDVDLVMATFRLMDGQLYRISRNGKYWRPVVIKLNKNGRGYVRYDGTRIIISRLLFILSHTRDIENGYLIDHIDNNPWNNSIDNLQELTCRDNRSKEVVYNPRRYDNRVVFKISDAENKESTFSIGTYRDDAERKAVWNTLAPLFLFRQGLKGTQVARERLLDLVDSGDIVAARAWVKAYALAHGIEI